MNRLFLFLYLFFFAFIGKAQKIALEHSFNTYIFSTVTENVENNNVEKYIIYDKTSNQVKIYNLDYSLYKNVNVNFPNQYNISHLSLPTIKLFNNDDLIEFVVSLYNSENIQYNTVLYNENGNILKEFKDVSSFTVFTTTIGDIKIWAVKQTVNGAHSEIYSLNNSVSSMQKSHIDEIKSAYPNPAITKITLPYQLDSGEQTVMHIYSLTGQLLKAIQIDYNFDKIELDVSDFNAGEYIYEYKGISNKFNVK